MPQIAQGGSSFASRLIRLFDCDLWNVGFHSSSAEVQWNTTEQHHVHFLLQSGESSNPSDGVANLHFPTGALINSVDSEARSKINRLPLVLLLFSHGYQAENVKNMHKAVFTVIAHCRYTQGLTGGPDWMRPQHPVTSSFSFRRPK